MPPNLNSALKKLLPSKLPPTLSTRPGTLYQVLSRFPNDGVGQRVHQTRWSVKDIGNSYWEVTRTQLKLEGQHGKAWGKLIWKGRPATGREERIRGGLKYTWRDGESQSKSPATTIPTSSKPSPPQAALSDPA
ncbi:hypothetical protein PHLGIDRAFT_103185 [Phlebiopsis gigantea 11061_1 CR5-6]|uniref:Uncharacterized protein n=1 Tax=Phlebiopsis gigantea (strain 11061_1 CR5-6) TaxID=745531 RepID=A0A0C3S1X7_PHLG1|nr:hypothetical protein PHLGIDRAFT_103185 [Phlebiopsis gigantea 11061_1 CR5-6]